MYVAIFFGQEGTAFRRMDALVVNVTIDHP